MVAKTWKQPNYPSIEGWKRRCYTYVQWNTATTWRDLENIMPQLFTFSFISLVLRNMLAKILQHGISEILLPIFLLGCLWYHDIYLSFIQIEFILVYSVRWWSSFISLHVPVHSPNTIYWRDYLYSIAFSGLLCQILVDHKYMGLFLGSLFCSIDLCVCSYASTRLFWLPWPCLLYTSDAADDANVV